MHMKVRLNFDKLVYSISQKRAGIALKNYTFVVDKFEGALSNFTCGAP